VTARAGNIAVSDTAWFMKTGTTVNEPLPSGVKDGIQYPSDDSVTFVLYAPGKNFIYLTGDFNDWMPDSIYMMKKDGDRFWVTTGGLVPEKEYAFQYLIDGELRIADPYTEKILDPDNDKHIPASVYPNLIPYPHGKTSHIAGVVQPGKVPFDWGEGEYSIPSQYNLIIYELLIRDFVSSHDIKEVTDRLDYLQKLGVNAIELMPFSEFEGNSSWGYNPSFILQLINIMVAIPILKNSFRNVISGDWPLSWTLC
jgi:1,4-alpha-glucan branching enzyme